MSIWVLSRIGVLLENNVSLSKWQKNKEDRYTYFGLKEITPISVFHDVMNPMSPDLWRCLIFGFENKVP